MNPVFEERVAQLFGSTTVLAGLCLAVPILLGSIVILILSERIRCRAHHAGFRLDMNESMERSLNRTIFNVDIHADETTRQQLRQQAKWELPATLISICAATCLLLSSLVIYAMGSTIITAYQHGYRGTISENPVGLWRAINASPAEDTLPDDLSGKLIILYRFGCQDCEAIHADLQTALQDTQDTYWIATRSNQGQEFLQQHPVDLVPSAVYTTADRHTFTYTLYKTSTAGAQLDTQALQDLLTTIQYDRQ